MAKVRRRSGVSLSSFRSEPRSSDLQILDGFKRAQKALHITGEPPIALRGSQKVADESEKDPEWLREVFDVQLLGASIQAKRLYVPFWGGVQQSAWIDALLNSTPRCVVFTILHLFTIIHLFTTIHDYSPLFTSIHHYSPLFTMIHLFTIIHHYSLFTIIHHHSPLFTIIHHYSQLCTIIHHYSQLLTNAPLFTIIHHDSPL